jgi:polyhydroxyalkanoate synthesis repressor PhaR
MSEHEQTPPPEGANGAPQQAGEKKEPKVIKRYTNRKLYDTVESRYVTLDEIAQMIKGGAEVKIIDNRSKEDLTSVTLAQIIFEEEKKRSQMPLGVLREIIRHGGEAVAGFYQEKAGTIVGKLDELKSKTESIREGLEEKVRGVTGIFRTKAEEASATVKQAVDTGVSAAQGEIERLQKKVQELEQKLAEFTKRS